MAARRSKGEGSIHQRPDGRWVAQFNVSPEGAIRKRKTVYGATKAEVRRKMGEAKTQLAQGNMSTTSMTMEKWLTHWLEKVVSVSPGTKVAYERNVKNYIIPALGRARIDRLTPDHVYQLHTFMAGKTTGTIHTAHGIARTAVNAAMLHGKTARNPFTIVPAPKINKRRRRALGEVELDLLLDHVAGQSDEARWMMSLLLGPRQGECLGLTWSHVDFKNMTIDLEYQAQRIRFRHGCTSDKPCGYKRAYRCHARILDTNPEYFHEVIERNICFVKPKTDSSRRIIPLPLSMVGPLRRRWVEYLEQKLNPNFRDHGLVWARADGSPLDDREDYWAWRALLDVAGVEKLALHGARNSAATKLMRDGVDLVVIRDILGHNDVAMTQGYQRADMTMARKAIDG